MASDPPASDQLFRVRNATPQLPLLGLIADDLTGACDAGVQFAQQGITSFVRLSGAAQERNAAQLLILDTASRHDLPEAARSKVQSACRTLLEEHRRVFYKKIDSTLRGNLGPEIEAAMESCGYSLAIVAPAFPAMGRRIIGGWLQVAGENSAQPLHLPSLLREQGIDRVLHFNCAALGDRIGALATQLEEAAQAAKTVAVIDAASQEDLERIARAAAELAPASLLVGSAGLAAVVAKLLARQYGVDPVLTSKATAPTGDLGAVVMVLGSADPVTLAQVNYLIENRRATLIPCRRDGINSARQALMEQRHVVARPCLGEDDDRDFAEFLTILLDSPVRGMVLSGGDTADMVCRILKVAGIKLEREIVPGIPWGWLLGGAYEFMPIVTKAGGFGSVDALVVVADFLAARGRDSA
jgi:D-threonate/D-erythronate kinase